MLFSLARRTQSHVFDNTRGLSRTVQFSYYDFFSKELRFRYETLTEKEFKFTSCQGSFKIILRVCWQEKDSTVCVKDKVINQGCSRTFRLVDRTIPCTGKRNPGAVQSFPGKQQRERKRVEKSVIIFQTKSQRFCLYDAHAVMQYP